MKTYITILLCVVAFTCLTLTAHAQAQRTFVSTSGSDANTASLCSATNPCRSFTAALTVTTAGGEIIALTSGGYGPVDITKSVQLIAPTGIHAAITAQPATAIGGTDAIRVNAPVVATVVIRGLTLNNVGVSGANGITFPSGERLYVENCVINGFDNNGISVDRSAAGSTELFVTDTIIRNGGASTPDSGIFLRQTTGGSLIRTTIDNCRLERAGAYGLFAVDNTRTTVRNTVLSRNTSSGFRVAATTGTTAELNLENCTATLNGASGIFVGDTSPFSGGTATARLSNTVSANNLSDGINLADNGRAQISDSTFNGNGGDGVGVTTNATAHISTSTIKGNGVDGVVVTANAIAHISDSNISANTDDGVDVETSATARISSSTINDNLSNGIELANSATSRAVVTFTTIFGNTGKGLNRQVGGVATSIGSNRIHDNAGGSDAFSATIAQQ